MFRPAQAEGCENFQTKNNHDDNNSTSSNNNSSNDNSSSSNNDNIEGCEKAKTLPYGQFSN